MSSEEQIHNIIQKWKIDSLFHFTDVNNISSIKEKGLLSIRDLAEQEIKFCAVSNDWSQDADQNRGLDAYVHLCFHNSHPMAFNRQVQKQNSISFLRISTDVLYFDNVLFTADVSNKSGVKPFSVDCFEQMIDCEVLFTVTDWSNKLIQERLQRARKAEILIPRFIPSEMISFPF